MIETVSTPPYFCFGLQDSNPQQESCKPIPGNCHVSPNHIELQPSSTVVLLAISYTVGFICTNALNQQRPTLVSIF
jgi:hypothetical protein